MSFYQRNLPHWHPEGRALFITWRLHGTHAHLQDAHSPDQAGAAFAAFDRELDRASTGPKWLFDPRIAACVRDALHHCEKKMELYNLIAYAIMPNHVHVVIFPHVELRRITQTIKGFTARRANQILDRTGQPFWQDESYDHWVRDQGELQKVIRYVEWNPVKAGLAKTIEDWPWSSAFQAEICSNAGS